MSGTYSCGRCNCQVDMHGTGLPEGWQEREGKRVGKFFVCETCAQQDAAKEGIKALNRAIESGDTASISSNDVITGAAQSRLRTIIERVERLEEDKAVISLDIKEVYAEAKGEGFDVKILRKVVALRKMDANKREEEEAILDLYVSAIGM